jgi:hypothetical protein
MIKKMTRTSLGCPAQYEGKLMDGNVFYFRERWGIARLDVAGKRKDLWKKLIYSKEKVFRCIKGNYEEELLGLFLELVTDYWKKHGQKEFYSKLF